VPRTALLLLASLPIACSTSSSSTTSPADASAGDATADAAPAVDASSYDASAIVAARPYTAHVPPSYDPAKPTPLVLMFHGASVTGDVEESYLRFAAASDAHGFLYAYGTGTVDKDGNPFWNATDACCNFYGSTVDDVTYVDAMIDDMVAKYNVDKKRVYLVGHSNGGFLAHRYACDRAPRVAAIAALAGDNWADASKCNPTTHVSVVQIHGDMDETIHYDGGTTMSVSGATGGAYPSAHASVATWAAKNACTGALAATGMTLDLDANLTGNETKVETYGGCPSGYDVALWTIQGGMHAPAITRPGFVDAVWIFLAAHPRP